MSNAGFITPGSQTLGKQWTPREIKAELIRRGVTIKQIAEIAGVTSGAVTQTIYQYKRYSFKGYRIREIIAEALERPVIDIWPDQWEAM